MLPMVEATTLCDSAMSGISGCLRGEHLESHLDRRELLHGIIVDVMRDPTPFVFGGTNHMMEELASLLVRLLQIVDDRAELRRAFGDRGLELLVVRALSLFQPADRLELRFAFGGEPRVVQRERGVRGELLDHRDLPPPHGPAVPALEGDDAEPVTTRRGTAAPRSRCETSGSRLARRGSDVGSS